MANEKKQNQKKYKDIINHLGGCSACRCKTAADHQIIEQQIEELSKVLKSCRNTADRILREGCGKKQETPCQKFQNTKGDLCAPCYKKSRLYIKWNKK